MNVVFGIDFTASNGHPSEASSLHSLVKAVGVATGLSRDDVQEGNAYERVIRAVCDIMAPYSQDAMFPAFGFGARLQDGTPSSCFALNGDPDAVRLSVPSMT